MEIICSSKELKKAIKDALRRENKSIDKVTIKHRHILFGNIGVFTEDNLIESYYDEFVFIPIRWYRIMKFLKYVPEQPIKLRIYDDLVDIYCVARF